ncbi:hypothetical protein EXIGLDRAFT_594385, partial [Exidia glandulosa HHB12029]
VQEGYRRPLQHTLQWYEMARTRVEQLVLNKIVASRDAASNDHRRPSGLDPVPSPVRPPATPEPSAPSSERSTATPEPPSQATNDAVPKWLEVARRLGLRCPACFGARKTGRPLEEGCDFHVAADGNFSQRHDEDAGDCPSLEYDPVFLVPKEFVDAVGDDLDAARKRPPRVYKREVPEDVIKHCENAHIAADGTRAKTAGDNFDDKGMMALICRHDIPLLACNIDTPGEQQKYIFAMIIWLSLHLPTNATICQFYDVGCVSDRIVALYDILPDDLANRIMFVTPAMHAYAHQWACQIVFSPRMKKGVGLTDGEGVERLWSRLRFLIATTRHMARQRRLFMLDRRFAHIQGSLRDDLGHWIQRRRGAIALKRKALAAQLSIRKPAIRAGGTTAAAARRKMQNLRDTHEVLTKGAEELYASLDIGEKFPELKKFGMEFARTLVMAYDAKCIARLKLMGRFFEWEMLDRAVGGKEHALGTAQHQKTITKMRNRTPALLRAITRYNTLCDKLKALKPRRLKFPLPEKLSEKLGTLKNDPSLMEDVWLQTGTTPAGPWLTDPGVRKGIRAQHILDRCDEEEYRVAVEEKNLYDWVFQEVVALESAL